MGQLVAKIKTKPKIVDWFPYFAGFSWLGGGSHSQLENDYSAARP
jgi:hypothetical protein